MVEEQEEVFNIERVIPFKSYFYNREKVDLTKVLTPPYDIISPEKQEYYYFLSPYNIVRAILGKEEPDDTWKENKYTRARKFWEYLVKEKIVFQDNSPSFYFLKMEYFHENSKKELNGFVGLLYLEEFGRKIFPHERTLKKTTSERMLFMEKLPVDFCPILGLYQDEKKEIEKILKEKEKEPPVLNIKDEEGTVHTIWKIQDKENLSKIQILMQDKIIFIGDGHHRYEVALRFKEKINSGLYRYVMVYFVNIQQEGITILPSQRLVKIDSFELNNFWEKLEKFFKIRNLKITEDFEFLKILNECENTGFVMYTGGENCYLLELKEKDLLNQIEDDPENIYWKELDVGILHNLLIRHILGKENPYEDEIEYLKDIKKTIELVKRKKFQVALFHKPTKVSDLVKISSAGEIMPPKSTYFYPKPLSGLVMMSRIPENSF